MLQSLILIILIKLTFYVNRPSHYIQRVSNKYEHSADLWATPKLLPNVLDFRLFVCNIIIQIFCIHNYCLLKVYIWHYKYEAAERKRRAAMESAKGGENGESIRGGAAGVGGAGGAGPRREVWVRPGGHRTTLRAAADDTLDTMTPVEVTFIIL